MIGAERMDPGCIRVRPTSAAREGAAVSALFSSVAAPNSSPRLPEFRMKSFLVVTVVLSIAATVRAAFPFAEATIDELQKKMRAGELTSRALTAAYLERIAEVDRGGPKLNSVIEVNPDAVAIADQLDAERRAGKVRGPLHGIPILIKD